MEGETSEEMAEEVNFTPIQGGFTRWHPSSIDGDITNVVIPPETTFSVSIDLSHYKVGDVIAIYSLARTDQDWVIGDSSVPAQSNIVNARTNPQWYHVHANSIDGGSLIKGRLDWFSVQVTLEIGECKYLWFLARCRNHSYTDLTPWHVGPQPGFFEGNEPIETSVRLSDEWHESIEKSELDVIALSLAMAMLVAVATVFCVFCREERDGTVSDAANNCRSPQLCVESFF